MKQFQFAELADQIQESFENNSYTLGVFIDFFKAFDATDHAILLKKLENYRIKGTNLAWFRKYLTNRKQYIQITKTGKAIYEIVHVEYHMVPFLDCCFFWLMSMIFHLLPRY